ncbi:hypothetical protein MNBD_NITROSPINAE01-1327 [hydrothermal vent metagenome]|uniref:Uncharacterized protein n=1 Tax=hydrothermal vent metagenome TaxID=652676 RepID=A0A3B1BQ18_9ZZZZ
MRRFIAIAVFILIAPICQPFGFAFSEPANNNAQVIGAINIPAKGLTLLSPGDMVTMDIDPNLIAKGDMLNIYEKTDEGLHPAGEVVITSGSGEPVSGRLLTAGREFSGKALVGFYLDPNMQMNWAVPFIKTVTDTFLGNPGLERINVAVIDVINEFGNRTLAGAKLGKEIRSYICARQQFYCANKNVVEKILWRNNAQTSRGINRNVKRALKKELGVDLIITGHLRGLKGKTLDVALLATPVSGASEKLPVWTRFSFSYSERGITKETLHAITAVFNEPQKSRFTARLVNVKKIEGMTAEYVAYRDFKELVERESAGMVVAGEFFLSIDGTSHALSADGLFFDGPVHAGMHQINIGYYPVIIKNGVRIVQKKTPVERSFKIVTSEGENFNLDIMGQIKEGYAVLAGDTYVLKKPDAPDVR